MSALALLWCGGTGIKCPRSLADRLVEFRESSKSSAIAGRFERGGAWHDITEQVLVVHREADGVPESEIDEAWFGDVKVAGDPDFIARLVEVRIIYGIGMVKGRFEVDGEWHHITGDVIVLEGRT